VNSTTALYCPYWERRRCSGRVIQLVVERMDPQLRRSAIHSCSENLAAWCHWEFGVPDARQFLRSWKISMAVLGDGAEVTEKRVGVREKEDGWDGCAALGP
jgi:hypothetical protein